MALPPAPPERQLKHRRSIDVAVYACGPGRWEVEARLIDVKTRDYPLASGLRRAGEPVHDMRLRLVIDEQMNILAANACTDAMPYPGHCDAYGEVYGRLVGLNLMQRFRQQVKERLGGMQGCTHLTEMAQVLPTAVVQAFAGEVLDTQESGQSDSDQQPFQIDRCHALRADGEAVRIYYPRWYRAEASAAAGPQTSTRPPQTST
ncbi:DUF2889 domain-containing protein [Caldimonas taiwanensis]|uniref:DUF2889 domain-containing protein n=1 Tax=Caldimonas taiwanensis TaxID=307483 RepID=UPI000781694C|nr:DUF2889 domain-containing protein [Caldimonas taiwanensis]